MTEADWQLIGLHLERIQNDMRDMKATLVDIADGQTELRQMILRLEGDMVQVKRLLVNLQQRLRAQS